MCRLVVSMKGTAYKRYYNNSMGAGRTELIWPNKEVISLLFKE